MFNPPVLFSLHTDIKPPFLCFRWKQFFVSKSGPFGPFLFASSFFGLLFISLVFKSKTRLVLHLIYTPALRKTNRCLEFDWLQLLALQDDWHLVVRINNCSYAIALFLLKRDLCSCTDHIREYNW